MKTFLHKILDTTFVEAGRRLENSHRLETISTNRVKSIIYIVLPIGIAFYIMHPLLKGDYLYYNGEFELHKAFMTNFLDALKRGELPTWNEYVECGHPAIYLGHYPISQNTIFYMTFGFGDFTSYFTRFLNLTILLFSFIYACKILRFSYLLALIGALTYFSVNFVTRFLITDTIGNLLLVPPLLMVLIIKIIAENKTKDILIFSLVYIFWLSGGHVTFVWMHMVMLSLVYWITISVFYGFRTLDLVNLKRFVMLFFVLFIVPLLAVAYQYYFVYDVISTSNRLKEGLIVSPFELIAWKQLMGSFQSSSYFWFGLFSILIYSILKLLSLNLETTRLKITPWVLHLLSAILLFLTVIDFRFASKSILIADYLPILNSTVFRIALLLYFTIHLILNRTRSGFFISLKDCFIFIVDVSLLSYYFYSPRNIIGDVRGYDYDLLREMSVPFQVLFTLSVLFSSQEYQRNKIVKIIVLSAIAQYFIRSHFTILLLRFSGFVWYATRDGTIFSIFFAILFMYGLRNMLSHFSQAFKNSEGLIVKSIRYGFLIFLLTLLVRDSFDKFYKGESHKYIFPMKKQFIKTPRESWLIKARKELLTLNDKLLELNKETKHFYRLFTPENHYFLGGNLQHHGIHEAFIYDSCISKQLKDLYDYTILRKNPSKNLKDAMPYFLFTKHVHAGLNLKHNEIKYAHFFTFLTPEDLENLQNQNIEFLWDIMQVKYLIIGSGLSSTLESFTNREHYKLLGTYPECLGLNLYEIVKNKSYSRLAILPLGNGQSYDEMIKKLNSMDIDVLRTLYSKLVFLDQKTQDFALLKNRNSSNTRYYEIFSNQDAILIDFESWNHSWGLRINNKDKRLQRAFQMFKGIRLEPGLNQIELTYNLKYFKELFILSVFTLLLYMILLGRSYYIERKLIKERSGIF